MLNEFVRDDLLGLADPEVHPDRDLTLRAALDNAASGSRRLVATLAQAAAHLLLVVAYVGRQPVPGALEGSGASVTKKRTRRGLLPRRGAR